MGQSIRDANLYKSRDDTKGLRKYFFNYFYMVALLVCVFFLFVYVHVVRPDIFFVSRRQLTVFFANKKNCICDQYAILSYS